MTSKIILWSKARKDKKKHIKVYLGHLDKDKYYPLNIWINPKGWMPTEKRIKAGEPDSYELNQKIAQAQHKFESLIRDNPTASIERIIQLYENRNEGGFFEFIDKYIEECEAGLHNRKHSTIKAYKVARKKLKEFGFIDFETIDLTFYNEFKLKLVKEGRSVNYIGSLIKNMKVFLNEATDRGINKNLTYKHSKFKAISEEVDNDYLTEDELKAILNADLKEHLARVRDTFIVASYTGLRYSDLSQITSDKIKDRTIKIRQVKTGGDVVIPLKKFVEEIIRKYHRLPLITNQKMNEALKDIAKAAKIKKRVSTHTARRSFATNAYLSGVPSIAIMRITGHSSEKTFLKYIKITNQENANELLLKQEFFK